MSTFSQNLRTYRKYGLRLSKHLRDPKNMSFVKNVCWGWNECLILKREEDEAQNMKYAITGPETVFIASSEYFFTLSKSRHDA